MRLTVRSDSVCTSVLLLLLVLHLKTKGKGMCLIAREMALDIAESVNVPSMGEHTRCQYYVRFFEYRLGQSTPVVLSNAR
eukprot:5046041-Amphidinium_carterae.4